MSPICAATTSCGAAGRAVPLALLAASLLSCAGRSPSGAGLAPPTKIAYDRKSACVAGQRYANAVLPAGEGEFGNRGFDRAWWSRPRSNPLSGGTYSGFATSWGRRQYDTYFGDRDDGRLGAHDPFFLGRDAAAPGAPRALRIEAMKMPPDLVGDPAVGRARFYSGVLDTLVDLRYGFFVARLRLPPPRAGMSPAWWLLTSEGTPWGSHGRLNGEWDIEEMFGDRLGDGLNAGTILWNSGAGRPQNWGGTYSWPSYERTTPSEDYHEYGALIEPGGAPVSGDLDGPGGPGAIDGQPGTGVTNYLDGVALRGHVGGADVTSGVGWKELMVMFQVGEPGGWLGTPDDADFPAYLWVQWIRVYRPTSAPC